MRIADYYGRIDPGVERLLGAWAFADGVEFVDRLRPNEGFWEVAQVEAPDHFHFFIQADAHRVDEEVNGVLLRRGPRPPGTVRVSQPEDRIRGSGVGPVRCFQVSLTRQALWDCAVELGMRPGGLELRDIEPRADYGITHLTLAHTTALDLGFTGDELHFQILRTALLRRLFATRLNRAESPRPFAEVLTPLRMRRVVDHIEDNLAGSLRLDDLANLARTSKFHFARAFLNTMGIAPHAFVVRRRIHRAAAMLGVGRIPLRDIARLCGFADHAHLSRTFKRQFGVSPSEHFRLIRSDPGDVR